MSEIVRLRAENIDSDRGLIQVKNAKGGKIAILLFRVARRGIEYLL